MKFEVKEFDEYGKVYSRQIELRYTYFANVFFPISLNGFDVFYG
jgi:hypothetical protein